MPWDARLMIGIKYAITRFVPRVIIGLKIAYGLIFVYFGL